MSRGKPGREPVLTWEDVERFKSKINPETGKPYNQAEIARIFGVSKSYISVLKSRTDPKRVSKTPAERAKENFPLKRVPEPACSGFFYRILRDHGLWVESPKELETNRTKYIRLMNFHRRLRRENLILEYDPNIPPSHDNVNGMFRLDKRRPEDGDLILRDNEYVEYTPISRRIYRLPTGLTC